MDAISSKGGRFQLGLDWLRFGLVLGFSILLLYVAFVFYTIGQPLLAVMLLGLSVGFALIFGSRRFYAYRFIFPGIAGILLFILFPVIYTVYLGFTNYSSFNLLSFDRAKAVTLQAQSIDKSTERGFAVAPEGMGYRIYLPDEGLLSDPVTLSGDAPERAALVIASSGGPERLLETRDAIKLRGGLKQLELIRPDGLILRNAGLRTFAEVTPDYEVLDRQTLRRGADGEIFRANHRVGFFESDAGERLTPGWRVRIGWANYTRVLQSKGVRAPLIGIFIWTVIFAVLSVGLTFALGLVLASVLQWPHLRFKPVYRVLLILPYAVPSFISILVFRGLFNQNFGEINLILEALFGIRPEWFTNSFLARTMIVIVNIWLGYPYMMLLAMGFLQSVPEDHRKAATIEGASALRVFFSITLPQIVPPFLPLLIASFAFNFNNMVLILLLTRGGPDRPGTVIPAGETDILASFTYRMAFMDSGTQFGLAGAITFLIFVIVGVIAYINFIALRRMVTKPGGAAA